jgi:hypothetical protein
MALKQNALTYLPAINIEAPSGDSVAIESLKGALYKIAEMQKDEVADGAYTNVKGASADPFNSSLWDVTIATGTYTLAFVSEIITLNSGLYKNPALSARRPLDIEIVANANAHTVRSALAALKFVDKLEDIAAVSGFASGTVTLATALADDTVTINGLVYTAVTGAKADNTEFSIDGTDTVDAADLADSINNDDREGTLGDVSATSALGVVTITTTVSGEAGNAVTLAEDTGDTTISVSGATLTGGGGDAVYTDVTLKGFTPFETFVWDIEKAGDVYTLTPTADS